jgi:hypothetical protein
MGSPQNDYFLFITALSGAQAKIVLLFLGIHGGMTVDEIRQRTGIKDKNTVQEACSNLAAPPFQILAHQTLAHGKVVWMPVAGILPQLRDAYFGREAETELTRFCETQEPKYLMTDDAYQLETTPRTSLSLGKQKREKTASEPVEHQNPNFEACYKAARAAGIGNPAAGQVADLRHPDTGAWITPELITAHCAAIKRPRQTIGLAIHRLKDWQELPQDEAAPAPEHRGDEVLKNIAEYFGMTLEEYKARQAAEEAEEAAEAELEEAQE